MGHGSHLCRLPKGKSPCFAAQNFIELGRQARELSTRAPTAGAVGKTSKKMGNATNIYIYLYLYIYIYLIYTHVHTYGKYIII